MWICLNDGFVSIVEDKTDANFLLVRARKREHLVAFFREHQNVYRRTPAKIVETPTPTHDYRWRVRLFRDEIAEILMKHVMDIDYLNFKASVKDRDLHDMYTGWWVDHRHLQEPPKRRKKLAAR